MRPALELARKQANTIKPGPRRPSERTRNTDPSDRVRLFVGTLLKVLGLWSCRGAVLQQPPADVPGQREGVCAHAVEEGRFPPALERHADHIETRSRRHAAAMPDLP